MPPPSKIGGSLKRKHAYDKIKTPCVFKLNNKSNLQFSPFKTPYVSKLDNKSNLQFSPSITYRKHPF
jgi:hypothetical protein